MPRPGSWWSPLSGHQSVWLRAALQSKSFHLPEVESQGFGVIASIKILRGRAGKEEPYRHGLGRRRNCSRLAAHCVGRARLTSLLALSALLFALVALPF